MNEIYFDQKSNKNLKMASRGTYVAPAPQFLDASNTMKQPSASDWYF